MTTTAFYSNGPKNEVFVFLSSLDAATDYLLNNPVPPPSLRQASSSGTGNADPAPAAPASGALAGGSSAPVASRPTGGNGNGGEQDELMRAIGKSKYQFKISLLDGDHMILLIRTKTCFGP